MLFTGDDRPVEGASGRDPAHKRWVESYPTLSLAWLNKGHTLTHTHTHMHAHNMYIHALTQVRKVIVKSFKPYVKKICLEENGHVVMMGVFDTVDDTVLVKKAILTVCVCV